MSADAVLKGEIIGSAARRRVPCAAMFWPRRNSISSLRVRYTLVGRDGKTIAGPAEAAGTTSFFVGEDVNTDERQALPLAAEELAQHLVSQLSEGW